MYIKKFPEIGTQMCQLGKCHWSVSRLVDLSKDLKWFYIPLNHLNVYHLYKDLTLRDMVMHFNAVNDANLSFPIILDEDGEIMDGRHRIMKAIMEDKSNILAVRFDENPKPCSIDD